jgi:hypothetical protein
MLAPPRDAREEGERISAFWGVLNLNNCFASRDGTCSNISYGGSTSLVIDTPWPLETADYVEVNLLVQSANIELEADSRTI